MRASVHFVWVFGCLTVFAGLSSAQRGTAAGPVSGTEIKTRSEREREREKYARRYKLSLTPAAIRRAQSQKTQDLPMQFFGESEPLELIAQRNLPPIGKENGLLQEETVERLIEVPERRLGRRETASESLLQINTLLPSLAVPAASFEGPGIGLAGFSMSGAPPDATLAVGPNHIVAMVNAQLAVFDKTGNVLAGPVDGNTIFLGAGGLCETTNRGDPILQYDRLADRWILSQFAFNVVGGKPAAPYLQCIGVSTTGDPKGTYYRYAVTFSSTAPNGFNDYGKLGIWNDGYYTSYNIFAGSPAGINSGVALCVSDRDKMLAGNASATTLCAPTTFYAGGASLLPADLDGPSLPTDTTRGGIFIRQSTVPALRYLRLKPNFGSGTVTLTDGFGGAAGSYVELPLGTTTRPCNGGADDCISQPGTSNKLDSLGDRMMYRLTYRNRGGVDSLIATQSVDPDGSGPRGSAVRWYEIRNPLGNPSDPDTSKRPFIHQSGTYDPGAAGDRWMSSAAMDKYGNILVGYSLANSAAAIRPSIAIAGRSQCDTINTLQAEEVAFTGNGSQTGTLTRWGDYSTMQVDPMDDTTFWYVGEYLSSDGTFNWQTRIVSYRFPTTTALASGDFNHAGNWSNGVPSASVTGIIPNGRLMTMNSPSTVCNLEVEAGGGITSNTDLAITGALDLNGVIDAGTVSLGCQATISGASSAAFIRGTIKKDFCSAGRFTFPAGSQNGYSPVTATVTALAASPSTLSVKALEGNRPGMNAANSLQRYWTLTSNGGLTTDLTFQYLNGDVAGTESSYKLYKWDGGTAAAVPFSLNTAANTVSASGISSFSDWSLGALAPTAAGVWVAGRVQTASGDGIAGVIVTLSDASGKSVSVLASPLGYFRFDDIPAGQSYVLSASSKRFRFDPVRLSVNDDLLNLELIGK